MRLLLASLIAAGGLLVGVSPALALPGPPTLASGFDSDTLYYLDDQVRVWFPRIEGLGSSWVRIPVNWNSIAPTHPPPGFEGSNPDDPAYYWFGLDRAVRAAAASHQHVVLLLEAPPSWALGRDAPRSASPYTWRPDPRAYGAFAYAVAERYSGQFPDPLNSTQALPRVSDFQAWNEPNLPYFLAPQWARVGRRWVPASPAIYRQLLNAAYASIKAVQPNAVVLAAGLAPFGDPPGVGRMRPVEFLRELLCLNGPGLRLERCGGPTHLDAIDIHPYGLTPTIHARNRDDVSLPDVGRLQRVLRAALRAHRVLPYGPKPIWITEIDWDSSPPDPNAISLATQARYVSLAFYEAWRQNVAHVLWYEIRDPGSPAGSFTGGGMFFSDGQAKPSTLAFRFPFVAVRAGNGTTTLWGRAPIAGRVVLEVSRRGHWQVLEQLRTTGGGVFYALRRLRSRLILRARVGSIVSYPWSM